MTGDRVPPRRVVVDIESDEELAALRGALLSARATELAEIRRRSGRLSHGYGSESSRDTMSDEVAHRQRRLKMLDRLLAELGQPKP